MLDHVGIAVSDYDASIRFYSAALRPLGYRLVLDYRDEGPYAGFSDDLHTTDAQGADFWLYGNRVVQPDLHLCFRAQDRAAVDAFHAAALSAGGSDNGTPGLRPDYHANYYAAFVHDLDGHNIEAVCHAPA